MGLTTSPPKAGALSGRSLVILLCCLAGACVIGLIRYQLKIPLALSLFFLIPIYVVSWHVGRWAGILMSIACTAIWLLSELHGKHDGVGVTILNESFRGTVFLVVTFVVSSLREALQRQHALAMTDELTGLPNRRAFFERAAMELARARRYRRPFTVVYLDLDQFKCVNDSTGHRAGDALLRRVADILRSGVRGVDIVARLGGDEFVLLLPETGRQAADAIVRRLFQQLLAATEQTPSSGVSIGQVVVENVTEDIDAIMSRADALMYAAKRGSGGEKIQREVLS